MSIIYNYHHPEQRPNTRVLLTQRARNRLTIWGLHGYDTDAFLARLRLATEVILHAVDTPLDAPEYVRYRETDGDGVRELVIAVGVVKGVVQTVLMPPLDLSMARMYFGGRELVERTWDEEIAA